MKPSSFLIGKMHDAFITVFHIKRMLQVIILKILLKIKFQKQTIILIRTYLLYLFDMTPLTAISTVV